MIHVRPRAAPRPFEEDEDANLAVLSVLGLVEQLARESRKLGMRCISDQARWRQQGFVRDIRERIYSVGRRVHVDPVVFLEQARLELGRRLGREITITETLLPESPPPSDPETVRLRDEARAIEWQRMLLDDRLKDDRARIARLELQPGSGADTKLSRARDRLAQLEAEREDLTASLRVADLALARYLASKVEA